MAKKIYYSKDSATTFQLGKKLAKKIQSGTIITCQGPLGSGKTTFVQGLANGLGVDKPITSPTFICIRQYQIPKKTDQLNHVDLYRLKNLSEILTVDLLGLFGHNNITVIEWPELIQQYLPAEPIRINFEYGPKDERTITIESPKFNH